MEPLDVNLPLRVTAETAKFTMQRESFPQFKKAIGRK
jgi:hypothetical protein